MQKDLRRNRLPARTPGRWIQDSVDVLGPTALAAVVFGLLMVTSGLPPLLSDAIGYSMTALRLVKEGFLAYSPSPPGVKIEPSAFITPGYALFLSAFYVFQRASNESPASIIAVVHPFVVAVQFGMSLAIVGLTALSGRLLGGHRLAWTTGVLASLYLPFAWAAQVALSEQLGTVLAACSLTYALWLCSQTTVRSPALMIGFGVLNGCLAMVRPVMALWCFVPLAYVAIRRLERPGSALKLALIAALGFALVLAPWVVRNAVVLHRFVPLSENSGIVLFDGAGGGELTPSERLAYDVDRARGTDDATALGRIGMRRIQSDWRTNPLGLLGDRLKRAGLVMTALWTPTLDVLWELNTRPEANPGVVAVGRLRPSVFPYKWMKLYRWLILAGAFAGLFFVRRSPRLLVVASMPFYVVAMHFLTLFNNRYFYPAMPAMIVLSGAGLVGVTLTAREWMRALRRG